MSPERSAPLARTRSLLRSLALLMAGALLQVACSGGGSEGGGIAPPVVSQPHITSFSAAKATVSAGESTTLTAVFENGTGAVSPFPGSVAITSGVPLTVSPGGTLTYTLTVTGGAGTTPVTATTTVTVVPAPAISTFIATPATISAGGTSRLNGVFSGGTGVVTPGGYALASGVDLVVGPASTTTYTLTVTNAAGAAATSTATVTVGSVAQPSISSFTASPAAITAGQTSILAYTFANGTGSINQSVGAVTSGGSKNVTPSSTTTYTLTVTGAAGTTPATAQATVTVGGASTRTVTGLVTYDFVPATYSVATKVGTLNFAGATQRPVRNGIVAVMNGSTVLVTGVTDETGHYSLTFTPPGSGTLQVVAMASCATPSIIVQDNTSGGAAYGIVATLGSSATTLDLRATHGWTGSSYNAATRLAAPFAVLDSMYTAARAVLAVRPSAAFPQLKVNWSPNNAPESGDKTLGQIGTSHFSPADNQIYILGKDGADTDEFDNHVIVHEWGHYFERNLSRSDGPGGPHGNGDVLDPRLAFGEGYGTALAAMLLGDPMYVDTMWGSGTLRGFGMDAETAPSPTDDPSPGPFSENTIIRLLYDIFDSGSSEAYDGVATGLGVIYDVLVGPEKTTDSVTTIGSFITGLKAQAGVNATAVNTLLAHYNIGPITTQWGDGDVNLKDMFTTVSALPFSGGVTFDGGYAYNKWQQNQYWVVTGTGGQITVKTTCTQDVDIFVFRSGTRVVTAETTSGNETASFASQAGVKYVVVVTGFGTTAGSYSVGVTITTP